jgi:hypothetical protein
MEPEGPLPCFQGSATRTYPESEESNWQPRILPPKDTYVLEWFSHLRLYLERNVITRLTAQNTATRIASTSLDYQMIHAEDSSSCMTNGT